MSKAFDSIKRGLEQAVRHGKGKRVAGMRLHRTARVLLNVIAKEPQAVLRALVRR
jgi:hypothetical protein